MVTKFSKQLDLNCENFISLGAKFNLMVIHFPATKEKSADKMPSHETTSHPGTVHTDTFY